MTARRRRPLAPALAALLVALVGVAPSGEPAASGAPDDGDGGAPDAATPPAFARFVPLPPSPPHAYDPPRARALYRDRCAICHGRDGRGDGPAAQYLTPPPRDFTRATYHVRSTPSGELPTPDDLFATLARGMHGSAMASWSGLSDGERWQLVRHLQSLSPRFVREPPTRVLEPPPLPPATPALVDEGRLLFARMQCASCHGPGGRGPAPSTLRDDAGHRSAPPDLAHPEAYRAGCSMRALYRTLATGLDGTPMPSYATSARAGELLALAAYLRSLFADPAACRDGD